MSMESHISSLGFPLGTALLLIIIISFSGIFSCVYHSNKLRSFRRHHSHPTDIEAPTHVTKAKPTIMMQRDSLPVLMPGDLVPKFIAMPCPCQPPRVQSDDVIIDVQKSSKLSPHVVVPLC